MTAPTMTEFLLARIAEDEAGAQAALNGGNGVWESGADNYNECRIEGGHIIIYDEGGHTPEQARHIARHDPARVLAECEAKRRVVEMHHREIWHQPASGINDPSTGRPYVEESDITGGCTICAGDNSEADWPCDTLMALAAVYADHPDYDEAWRA